MKERGYLRYFLRAGVMSKNEGEGGGGTLGVNGFLAFESTFLVKNDNNERRHVCL